LATQPGAKQLGFAVPSTPEWSPQPIAVKQSHWPTPFLIQQLLLTARLRRHESRHERERLLAEREQLLQQLRHQAETLAETLQTAKLSALAELAGGAGHEINNPLAVISGNAQLLLANETDPKRRLALESMMRQTRRLSDIISNMMQFARPRTPAPSRFLVADWLQKQLDLLQPVAQLKLVQFRATLPETTWVALGDAEQLGRALRELIYNAIEAVASGGSVHVSCSTAAADGTIRCIVEDDGPGPSPAIQEHLFDPFFSGRQAGRGRGLGLSTAWRLANINGGTVQFDAEAPQTRFVLQFPSAMRLAQPERDRRSA
ncbi:MAG: sensor histidine kinase, partial [Gemmataceae bacterium]